jgi:hypothetical protein
VPCTVGLGRTNLEETRADLESLVGRSDRLSEFWHQTKVLGGRPGQTTFRVRNHDWSKEGLLPWLHGTEEGWSYVIATSGDCVEVVSSDPPVITVAQP